MNAGTRVFLFMRVRIGVCSFGVVGKQVSQLSTSTGDTSSIFDCASAAETSRIPCGGDSTNLSFLINLSNTSCICCLDNKEGSLAWNQTY